MFKSYSSEYQSWHAMKARCLRVKHPHYNSYGGRGITVCGKWIKSFDAFLADLGPRPTPSHTLERIDSNKGYEPSNCRWATRTEQAHNRRDNHRYSHNGESLTLREWARKMGTTHGTLGLRLKRGWPEHLVFSIPVGQRNSRYAEVQSMRG